METPTVTFELEPSDYRALVEHMSAPVKRAGRWVMLIGIGAVSFIGVVIARSKPGYTVAMIMLALLVLLIGLRSVLQRATQPLARGSILTRYELTLREVGVDIRTPQWQTLVAWSSILAVEETSQHIFLRLDRMAAYVIPKRALADAAALQAFLEVARARAPHSSAG